MPDKIMIAIPSGKSSLDVDHAVSVTDTLFNLYEAGMRPERRIVHGNCYVALCRSLLAHQFMQTDCTHLFFWDDDVASPPGAVRRLLAYDRDIIVAPYPKKVAPKTPPTEAWPVVLTDGIPDAFGLLECEKVATGFLLIKRRVIEAMYAKYADRVFYHKPGDCDVIDLFPTGILHDFPRHANGKHLWWGEDYAFSVLAQRAGFKMWLDPIVPLIHAGRNVWRGDFTKNADEPAGTHLSSAA